MANWFLLPFKVLQTVIFPIVFKRNEKYPMNVKKITNKIVMVTNFYFLNYFTSELRSEIF